MKKIIIVCDNIRSAFNIGAIFRTADSLGSICEIYLCGISPTPQNNKVTKTSLGAENSVKWKYYNTLSKAISDIKKNSIPIYVLEQTSKSINYKKVEYPDNLALVVGNEIDGVNLIEVKDEIFIEIPMCGIKESLNVEVATAIILYHLVKNE